MDGVEAAVDLMHAEPRTVSPYFVSSVIPNMAACEVAIDLGVHGPVTASALACASGIHALLEARRLILSGEADVVIAGGTDSAITPVMFTGLSTMGALSKRNDSPEQASRPFDADRDGFVFGEGAVVWSSSRPSTRAHAAPAPVRGDRGRRPHLGRLPRERARPRAARAVSAMRKALQRLRH